MLQILKKHIKFFAIQFLTILNENIFKNVLILLINHSIYKNSIIKPHFLVLVSSLVFLISQLLFSIPAGKICDKFNKIYLIKRLKTLEIFLYSFILFSFWSKNIILLIISLFIVSIQSVYFEIIKFSVIPEVSIKNEYLLMNSLTIGINFFSIIVGVIFSYLSLIKYVGNFLISLFLIFTVTCNYHIAQFLEFNEKIENNSIKITHKINFNFLNIKNLIFIAKRKYLFLTSLGVAWFWFMTTTFISQLEFFAKSHLNANQTVAIFFILTFILGIIIGIIFCNKIFKNKINIAFTPASVIAITFLTYRLFDNNLLPSLKINEITFFEFFTKFVNVRILLNFLFIGIFSGVYIVPLYSFLENKTKKINRGRIFSGINLLNNLFIIISILCSYLLSKTFLVIDIFLFIAIANLIVGYFILTLLPKKLFFLFGRWLLTLVFNVKIEGLENYENVQDKRVIIIANHQSFLDAALIALFVEEDLSFAMEVKISKKWWVKPFSKLVNCYTLDSTNPMALKSLINLSKSGKKIMIFPEGRITTTGIMMKIYEGPAMIAEKSGALLVPIKIDGAQYSLFSRLKNKIKRSLFPDITLTIKPAQKIKITQKLTARQKRVEAGNILHKIMLDLFYSTAKSKETIFEALIKTKKILGGNHEIVEDTKFVPLSYNQLITKSFVFGNHLSIFTTQKEYVGILLPTAVANIVMFLALHTRDRIPVMINFTSGIKNIISACKSTKIRFILTSNVFIEKGNLYQIINALIENDIKIIYLEDESEKISLKSKLLGVIFSKFPSFAYKYTTKNLAKYTDIATVLFTSGSEKAPKGVALTHLNFNANRHQLLTAFNFSSQDKIFVALPLFHSFGLAATLISLITGSRIFFYPTPLHYRIIPELIYRTNSTIMFATNTFLEKYAKFANPYDFYSLKFIAIGGEKLTERNKLNWADKFSVKLFEGYGATECAPMISFNSPMKYKFGTVGTFVPGIEYKLEKVEDITEGGKLLIKGDNIFKGYIFENNPCEIIEPKDGWYDTGDVVKIDQNGFVSIIGRAKRFAKIAGEMVSMTMVESELSYIWTENTNAVISEKDDKKGEKLIIITNNKEATIAEVIQYFKKHELAEISIPKEIRYMENIPLLGTGKINYVELEKILLA